MRNKKILFALAAFCSMQLAMAAAPIVDNSTDANQDANSAMSSPASSSSSLSSSSSDTVTPDIAPTSSSRSQHGFSSSSKNMSQQNQQDTAAATESYPSAVALPPPIDTSSMSTKQRLSRLEKQINNLNQSNYQRRIDDLQQQVQTLTGKTEEQEHTIKELQQQVQDYYKDLNNRVEAGGSQNQTTAKIKPQFSNSSSENNDNVSASPRSNLNTAIKAKNKHKTENAQKNVTDMQPAAKDMDTDSTSPTSQTSINNKKAAPEKDSLKEQQVYQAAFDSLQSKQYNDGISKLRIYLKKYPDGTYASNAHYWLGEMYFLMKNLRQANIEFAAVINKYPTSSKAPEALLKFAMVNESEGKHEQAQKALKILKRKFPNSAAAKIAAQQQIVQ